MDFEKLPSKPVIMSQYAATMAVEKWQKENLKRQITDMEGFKWDVKVQLEEKPSADNVHVSQFRIRLWLEEDASVRHLVETGILDASKDARALELLANRQVPFALKPVEFLARNIEQARNMTLATTDMIAKKMSITPLREVKRQIIFRFIDSSTIFESAEKRL